MIYGIGIDIVSIRRIERMLERWGPFFTQRVYTPGEIAFCEGRSNPGQHFALRWAAKEAMLKALGLGLRGGIKWTDIEVVNDPSGRPSLKVHNQAKGFLTDRNIKSAFVSISHEKHYGIAQVVLEV
ncbi:MAG: holo-[acyl-carrier-protein] synthase [Proteobacteria bacterium]|nr:holo-[acyl-carrier-protein] synthase [Pseudomonadota bacterium]